MPDSERTTANPSVVLREEFDDWAVLFNQDTGDGYALDPVGVYIWKRLDGKHTPEQIVTELRKDFEDVPPEVLEHVGELVEDLVKHGLVGSEQKTNPGNA